MGLEFLIGALVCFGIGAGKAVIDKLKPTTPYIPPTTPNPPINKNWDKPKITEKGQVIIDDYVAYSNDLKHFDYYTVQQWAKAGKYNLPDGQYTHIIGDSRFPELAKQLEEMTGKKNEY